MISSLGALAFFLILGYYFVVAKPKNIDFDMIPIATIYEEPRPQPKPKPTPVKKKPKQKKVPKPVEKEHPMMDDCVSALVALGNKKSDAKSVAKRILENDNPKTIQDFLVLACKH